MPHDTIMTIVREIIVLIANILFAYLKTICSWFIPKEKKDLFGKVVVLTGSAHGIGKEISIKLHQLGARLALIDINQNLNEKLVEYLRSKSPNNNDVIGYCCDLTDESEFEEVVGQILLDFGHVDILINNAGFVKCAPFLELSKQDIRQTFNVNVFPHFWLIKHFLPTMIERRSGHIVAIGSIAGLLGNTNIVDYCASKHAVVGLMTALDHELRSLKHDEYIKLTTICPMAIATGMFKRLSSRFNFLLPILSPERVATTVVDAITSEDYFLTIPRYVYWFVIIEKIIPREVLKYLEKFLAYKIGKH